MKNKYRQNVTGAVICFTVSFLLSSVASLVPQWAELHGGDRFLITGVLFIIALVLGILGLVCARDAGEESSIGTLADKHNFIDNNIYQVVGLGAYYSDGARLCFLRLQDNEVKAFKLHGEVPDVFRWTAKKDKPWENECIPYPLPASSY